MSMKKFLAFLVIAAPQLCFAGVEADIGFIEFNSSSSIKTTTIVEEASFGNVIFTIEPMQLGNSDGKGVEIEDVNGNRIFFSIDDGAPLILFDYKYGVVGSSSDVEIAVGEEYRFIVNVTQTNISVQHIKADGPSDVFDYARALTPPLEYKLVTQRSGAKFKNLLVYSND